MATGNDGHAGAVGAVLLVDDLRRFRDGRPVTIARTSAHALQLLTPRPHLEQLWLDHDLGGDDTTMPIVELLEQAAFVGDRYPVGTVVVHTSNNVGARTIHASMRRYGYHVVRVDADRAGLYRPTEH